jgi:hypothetical protein
MLETPRILSCEQFNQNYHQSHAHRHPFPPGMINNLLQPSSNGSPPPTIVSMLIPRAHELARVNEEESQGND